MSILMQQCSAVILAGGQSRRMGSLSLIHILKVVIAIVKLVIGKKPNPSILEKAPTPAIAISPNELMLDCTTTLALSLIHI